MSFKSIKAVFSTLFIFIILAGAAFVTYICQTASYFVIRPFSKITHDKLKLLFTNAFFLCSSFLLETWNRVSFKCYGDRISVGPSYLIIINHATDVDGLLGLAFTCHLGYPYPGCVKGIVKAVLGKVPLFGPMFRNAGFLFLTRSWNNDKDSFFRSIYNLREVKNLCPLLLCLFPEGTRLTPDKLERSKEYTSSMNLPVLNNLLFPRFKAFTVSVECLRNEFDGILDTTFIYEGDELNVKSAFAGTTETTIHTHLEYIPMDQVPEGEEQLKEWLKDRWYMKDKRIQSFKDNKNSLGEPDSDYFPIKGKRSLAPFYLLVLTFISFATLALVLVSRVQNGIVMLLGGNFLMAILTTIFIIVTLKPSKKGSTGQAQSNSS